MDENPYQPPPDVGDPRPSSRLSDRMALYITAMLVYGSCMSTVFLFESEGALTIFIWTVTAIGWTSAGIISFRAHRKKTRKAPWR